MHILLLLMPILHSGGGTKYSSSVNGLLVLYVNNSSNTSVKERHAVSSSVFICTRINSYTHGSCIVDAGLLDIDFLICLDVHKHPFVRAVAGNHIRVDHHLVGH